MSRMEHVTVRLPSELVDELHREGEAMGCGMSWAMRRRLEAASKSGSRRSRKSEGNEPRAGGGKPDSSC
jgi:Ribbon-helix-helix protein, copG family